MSLTAAHATAVALTAQGLTAQGLADPAPADVDEVLAQLRAIQLDTIAVLARTHELVPYSRLGAVGRSVVEDAYWAGSPARTFEYWAHALCVIPVADWPYFAFRRRQSAAEQARRSSVPTSVVAEVRARLADGPVTVTDLGGAKAGPGWFNQSAAKIAVERLYWTGEVACVTRTGWKRVYDLAERVLPASVAGDATDEDCYGHLVTHAGAALGVATRKDLADYHKLRLRDVDTGLVRSPLVPVTVHGWDEPAWADPGALRRADTTPTSRTTLLSPFDSLIWERRRMHRLFGVSMLFEAYRPKEDRKHGYYTMPLLVAGRIAGHVDPTREGATLVARSAVLHKADDLPALVLALREAAAWVGCTQVRVEQAQPRSIMSALHREFA